MILTDNLKTYFQLVIALRSFLKDTLSLEQCKEIVKKRLEERDKNFIEIVKRNIYENEKSPYLKLLNLAGCEFGDFRSCVLREGIEKTLERQISEPSRRWPTDRGPEAQSAHPPEQSRPPPSEPTTDPKS